MTIKQAKENVLKNYDERLPSMTTIDARVFLHNTMEQIELVVRENMEPEILKAGVTQALAERQRIIQKLQDEVWASHELSDLKSQYLLSEGLEKEINEMCLRAHNEVLEKIIKEFSDET